MNICRSTSHRIIPEPKEFDIGRVHSGVDYIRLLRCVVFLFAESSSTVFSYCNCDKPYYVISSLHETMISMYTRVVVRSCYGFVSHTMTLVTRFPLLYLIWMPRIRPDSWLRERRVRFTSERSNRIV